MTGYTDLRALHALTATTTPNRELEEFLRAEFPLGDGRRLLEEGSEVDSGAGAQGVVRSRWTRLRGLWRSAVLPAAKTAPARR
jgi:hypothetical protein